MSRIKKRKRSKTDSAPVEEPARRRRAGAIVLVFGLAAMAALVFYQWQGRQGSRQPPPATAASTPPTETPAPAKAAPPEAPKTPHAEANDRAETTADRREEPGRAEISQAGIRALRGRWGRTDGDYTIDVRKVDPDGRIEAAYFNPRPIRVSQAKASQEAGATRVFIELRDTGYPGCTYRLSYNPQSDCLEGVYYQAALQQQYDVIFVRLP